MAAAWAFSLAMDWALAFGLAGIICISEAAPAVNANSVALFRSGENRFNFTLT